MLLKALYILVSFAGLALFLGGCVLWREHVPAQDFQPSDHFADGRFFVPGAEFPNGLLAVAKWQLTRDAAPWPDRVTQGPLDHPPARVEGAALRVVLVGHASVLLQTAGLNILVDPVWSERASPVSFAGPKRVNAPGIDWKDLPKIDVVLITHGHYDHADRPTLERLEKDFHPRFVVPLGNLSLLPDGARADELDWHQGIDLSETLRVTLTPAQHWVSRAGFDRNRALWGAFVLQGPGGSIYIAGDTGFGDGRWFRETGERYGPFRLAVLPVGAYEPRWFMAFSHMNPAEAVKAMKLLRAESAIGYHWGTFQLTDEARDAPKEALAAALVEEKIDPARFRAFEAGEVWTDTKGGHR